MTEDGRQQRRGLDQQPDIRRRLRAREGGAKHALATLLEALRMRSMILRGRTVLLIGFTGFPDDSTEGRAASEIADALKSGGAKLSFFETSGENGAAQRADMMQALHGTDIVLIDTDSTYVRTLRPKEMRALGVEIIVPTTLAA